MTRYEDMILELTRLFRPPKRILHSLVFLALQDHEIDINEWKIGVLGVYSDKVENTIKKLIETGKIKVCEDDTLTTDKCVKKKWDVSWIVRRATDRFLLLYTIRHTPHTMWIAG